MEYLEKISLKKEATNFKRIQITRSSLAADYIKKFYHNDIEILESVFILMLNRSSQTIGYAKISQGGVSGAFVDIKIILKYAIESLASGIIVAHNHPSGSLIVSNADKNITKKIKSALNIIDVELRDHLILTKEDYISFSDKGIL